MMDKLFHHKDKHAGEEGTAGEQSAGSAGQQQGQPQQHEHKESEKVGIILFVLCLPGKALPLWLRVPRDDH